MSHDSIHESVDNKVECFTCHGPWVQVMSLRISLFKQVEQSHIPNYTFSHLPRLLMNTARSRMEHLVDGVGCLVGTFS